VRGVTEHNGGMLSSAVGRFRLFALAEAVSWAGLLIGMFFKYVVVENEIGVKVFGPVHGVIFVGYVLVTLMLAQRWDRRTLILGLVASIPPFGTVVFERWANRTGRLTGVQTADD
jgi:integral membrane protein